MASGRWLAFQRQQGDDDVFLVVEVTDQAGGGEIQRVSEAVGVVGRVGGLTGDSLMEGDGGVVKSVQMGVDGVVVPVQKVEAGLDTRLNEAEVRKIVPALDPVVAVQMLQEGLQRRHQGDVQTARVKGARAPARRGLGHLNLLGAKAGVHIQPKGGGVRQGAGPALTREGLAQIEHLVGQAGADAQRVFVVMRFRRQRRCSG